MKTTLIIASAFIIGSAGLNAHAQSGSGQAGKPPSTTEMKVQNAKPSNAMADLQMAVRALREASVWLVEPGVAKQAGPARDKAFEAAQAAIYDVQRAMALMPDAYQPGDRREAKDWPVVAAKIEQASAAIERAAADIEKQSSDSGRSKAASALHAALDDAEKAMRALPEWRAHVSAGYNDAATGSGGQKRNGVNSSR